MKHFTKQNITKDERFFLSQELRKFFKELYDDITNCSPNSTGKYSDDNFQMLEIGDYKDVYNSIAFNFLKKFYNKQLKKSLSLDESEELPKYYDDKIDYIDEIYDTLDDLYDIICDIAEAIIDEPSFKLGSVSSSYEANLWFVPEYGKINLKKKTNYKDTMKNIKELKVLEDYETDYPVYGIHGFISEDTLYLVSSEQYNKILEIIQ